MKEPDDDAVKAVRRFARLTGDLGALSEPDVKVIALAYMLERDAHGVKHLRSEPPPLVLSKHKHNRASKQPGWDFVPNSDEWAELDELNLEAERSAAAVTARMASAIWSPEAPAPLPKRRWWRSRCASDWSGNEKRREIEDQDDVPPVDDAPDAEDDDEGGWEQNVSRTTRVRRKKREQRRLRRRQQRRRRREKAADDPRVGEATATATRTRPRGTPSEPPSWSSREGRRRVLRIRPGEVPDDDDADGDESAGTVPFESTVASWRVSHAERHPADEPSSSHPRTACASPTSAAGCFDATRAAR